jgi:hypothetical protein
LFNTLLGDTTGLNLAIFDGRPLWLGVTVGSDPESAPRMPIAYVPYALRASLAGNADLLDGQHGSGYATAAHDHWGSTWTGTGAGLTLSGGKTGLAASGSAYGLLGESTAGDGAGVLGFNPNGPGVAGRSSLGSGLDGASDSGSGIQGYSKDGYGVRGESLNAYGGFFTSGTDHADLALGGAVGRINTDPNNQNSDLILSSNNDIIARLDNDSGENGVLRVKNSGGVDVCTVDESGNVIAASVAYSAPRVHYFSVSSEDFVPWANINYSNSGGCGGAYISATGGSALVAAVHLPQGATVTRFEAFFYDASSSDMTVTLYGQYLTGCGFFGLAEVTSSGTAGYYSLADTSIGWPTINNAANAYHVKAFSSAWDGSYLRIKGAVITYTISEAP